MTELLMQYLKKNSFFKYFFFLIIFFCNTKGSYAKVYSDFLDLECCFMQGGLLFGKTKPKNKVFFNDNNIFVNQEGDFFLAIGRDHKLETLITVKGLEKK